MENKITIIWSQIKQEIIPSIDWRDPKVNKTHELNTDNSSIILQRMEK